jgi:hypothetical protein
MDKDYLTLKHASASRPSGEWSDDLYEEPGVKDANGEPVVTRVLTLMLAEEY